MQYTDAQLNQIYDRTSGKCHICGKKLSFSNYGLSGRKGAWHVEHSNPKAKGGTYHLNNLFAACVSCNQEKGIYTSKTARSWHNRKRAPLSRKKRKKAKTENAIIAGGIGAIIGGVVAGPPGAIIGGGIGAKLGHNVDPDEK